MACKDHWNELPSDLREPCKLTMPDRTGAAGTGSYYPSVDFTDPISPILNSTARAFIPTDVVVAGDHAFYSDIVFPSAVPIVNIKDPDQPIYQALIDMSEFGSYDCTGVDADFSFVVCTARNRLYISQYRELQDVSGIAPNIPPFVCIECGT